MELGEPYAIVWPSQEDWHGALENFNATVKAEEVAGSYVTGGLMWSWAVSFFVKRRCDLLLTF